MISLEILKEEPKQEDFNKQHLPIAVLLEGKFTSAFKNRLTPEYYEKFGKVDIKESPPNKMLFVADGDIIKNQLHYTKGYPLPLGYDQFTGQTFGNRDFILNSINYLLDDSGLISIRSRELKLRLLDKTKIKNNKIYVQLINLALPILLIIIFGVLQSLYRKSKYAKL